MKNVLYIIKVVALACAAGVIMTILGAFPGLFRLCRSCITGLWATACKMYGLD